MKFTDGYWQIRKGMTPHYAAQVHDLDVEPASITVYAPTKKLQGRGDTFNLPLLTIQYSSPAGEYHPHEDRPPQRRVSTQTRI